MDDIEFDKKWSVRKIIEETIRSTGLHTTPAPETIKTFARIETILAVQAEKHIQIDEKLDNIKETGEKTYDQAKSTNGRVTKLEQWSEGAQTLIESTVAQSDTLAKDYSINKTRIWTALSMLLFVGGAVISLSIMAINSKIKDGIQDALAEYEVQIK